MFPPNHPHYGTNQRRFRCPTGNKRIGLIAVIGICLFLCGFLVAFDTTHDQHILTGIGTQHIPYPIYPHSESNKEHLAVENRRRLTPEQEEALEFETLFKSILELSHTTRIVQDSFMPQGDKPAEYEFFKKADLLASKEAAYPPEKARTSVGNWMRDNGGALIVNGLYPNVLRPSVSILQKAQSVVAFFRGKQWPEVQEDPQFPVMQALMRRQKADLNILHGKLTRTWNDIMGPVFQDLNTNSGYYICRRNDNDCHTKMKHALTAK